MTKEELQARLGDMYIDLDAPKGTYKNIDYINAINKFINLNPWTQPCDKVSLGRPQINFAIKNNVTILPVEIFANGKLPPSLKYDWDRQDTLVVLDHRGQKKLYIRRNYGPYEELHQMHHINTIKAIYKAFVLGNVTTPSFMRRVKEARSILLAKPKICLAPKDERNTICKIITDVKFDIRQQRVTYIMHDIDVYNSRLITHRSPYRMDGFSGLNKVLSLLNNYNIIDEGSIKQLIDNFKTKTISEVEENCNAVLAYLP